MNKHLLNETTEIKPDPAKDSQSHAEQSNQELLNASINATCSFDELPGLLRSATEKSDSLIPAYDSRQGTPEIQLPDSSPIGMIFSKCSFY